MSENIEAKTLSCQIVLSKTEMLLMLDKLVQVARLSSYTIPEQKIHSPVFAEALRGEPFLPLAVVSLVVHESTPL